MITTKEILHVLNNEEIPEEEREHLEILLQERADNALSNYDKTVSVHLVTSIKDMVDFVDLSDKMLETGSDNIDDLVHDIVKDKIQDLIGSTGWSEINIED